MGRRPQRQAVRRPGRPHAPHRARQGDLWFDRKPHGDKVYEAEATGLFAVIQRYRAEPGVNGGNPASTTTRFKFINARISYTRKHRVFDADAVVASIKGKGPTACAPGGNARITMTQRGGKANDLLTIRVYNGSTGCFGFDGNGEALKITIDHPVKIS